MYMSTVHLLLLLPAAAAAGAAPCMISSSATSQTAIAAVCAARTIRLWGAALHVCVWQWLISSQKAVRDRNHCHASGCKSPRQRLTPAKGARCNEEGRWASSY